MDDTSAHAARSMTDGGPGAGAQDFSSVLASRIDGLSGWIPRYFAPLVLGLIMLGDSWDAIVISYVMPGLRAEWHLGLVVTGTLISTGYVGNLAGGLILGPAAEKIGRMPVFTGSILGMCICSLACALTRDLHLFFGLRLIEGFFLGGAAPACISYVNELAPTKTRGRYFSIFQFIMTAGYPAVSISSPFLIPAFGWRFMLILGAIPALFIPFVLWALPESPRWLARAGRLGDANRALAKLGAAPVDERLPLLAEEKTKIPWATLFNTEYRKRTIVVSILWFCGALASGAFASWLPTIYVQIYHVSMRTALSYVAIPGTLYLVVPLVFAAIIDAVGRRGPAIFVGALSVSCLIALILLQPKDMHVVVALITTAWVSAAAGNVILWPYTGEVYPTRLRSTGMGFTMSLARAGSMLTPVMVGGALAASGSITSVFNVMAVLLTLATVLWATCTEETAKKRLEQSGS